MAPGNVLASSDSEEVKTYYTIDHPLTSNKTAVVYLLTGGMKSGTWEELTKDDPTGTHYLTKDDDYYIVKVFPDQLNKIVVAVNGHNLTNPDSKIYILDKYKNICNNVL